jgi:hypothetical protein
MIVFCIWKDETSDIMKKLTYRQAIVKDTNQIVYIVHEDCEFFFVKVNNTSPVEKFLKKDIIFV